MIQNIQKLREMTGASIIECRNAIAEAKNDFEKALTILTARGKVIAAKKQERIANDGVVHAYIHGAGKVGVLVELRCETDFVARNEEFKALAHEIALQIAAMKPTYIRFEDIPENVLRDEKEIFLGEVKDLDKPQGVKDAIVSGKIKKRAEEICLLEQSYIKNQDETVADLVKKATAKLGEKIEIARFSRFEI